MQIFYTKKAFTQHILELNIDDSRIKEKEKYVMCSNWMYWYIGRDIFFSRKEAVQRVNKMKRQKILNLEKQIEKLKSISF